MEEKQKTTQFKLSVDRYGASDNRSILKFQPNLKSFKGLKESKSKLKTFWQKPNFPNIYTGYPHVLELTGRVFDARNPRNPLGNHFIKNTDFQELRVQNPVFNSKTFETDFNAFQAQIHMLKILEHEIHKFDIPYFIRRLYTYIHTHPLYKHTIKIKLCINTENHIYMKVVS